MCTVWLVVAGMSHLRRHLRIRAADANFVGRCIGAGTQQACLMLLMKSGWRAKRSSSSSLHIRKSLSGLGWCCCCCCHLSRLYPHVVLYAILAMLAAGVACSRHRLCVPAARTARVKLVPGWRCMHGRRTFPLTAMRAAARFSTFAHTSPYLLH